MFDREVHVGRAKAAVGSTLFFAAAPGTVAGLLPWLITGWEVHRPVPGGPVAQVLGVVLLAVSVPVLVHAFWRFVAEGVGTPAPAAPTEHLVVGGLYRYTRNPMYLAVMGAIVGQALLLGQPALLAYGAVVALAMVLFARLYEEPALARRFGAEYDAYRRAVPAWRPRLHPWRPVTPAAGGGRPAGRQG